MQPFTFSPSADGPDRGALFEFRCWPRVLPEAAGELQRNWTHVRTERRDDIYLLPPRPGADLVKLRAGERLEMKHRLGRQGALELWRTSLSEAFPLPPGPAARLSSALGREGAAALPPGSLLSPSLLLATLWEEGTIACVRLHKTRAVFETPGARAEVTHLSLSLGDWLTFALEAEAAEVAEAWIETLGLGDFANLDYGARLRAEGLGAPPTARALLRLETPGGG
ncbi:MAG: hypothetical protein HXY25_13085 [Alphaproteobacteria bacterium]|nr:hypothetical protein [Alphaproteobacteria bacterium]